MKKRFEDKYKAEFADIFAIELSEWSNYLFGKPVRGQMKLPPNLRPNGRGGVMHKSMRILHSLDMIANSKQLGDALQQCDAKTTTPRTPQEAIIVNQNVNATAFSELPGDTQDTPILSSIPSCSRLSVLLTFSTEMQANKASLEEAYVKQRMQSKKKVLRDAKRSWLQEEKEAAIMNVEEILASGFKKLTISQRLSLPRSLPQPLLTEITAGTHPQ